jgi:hypothetical protein
MHGYIAIVKLEGDTAAGLEQKFNQEMGKREFNPFFIGQGQKHNFPAGIYIHEPSSEYDSVKSAHAAVAEAVRAIDVEASIAVFERGYGVYSGRSAGPNGEQ